MKFLGKFKYLFALILILGIVSFAQADVTGNFWLKGSNGQLYTNSGNGQGQAIINVAGCNGCGGGGGAGTVTTVSVVSANGLAGTVANAATTPAITLRATPTGILQSNGTALSAITVGSGLDFTAGTLSSTTGAPGGLNTQLQYNNNGVFAGISGAVTNGTAVSLTGPHIGGADLTTSTVNGVTLTTGGGTTTFLNANGAYSVPPGLGTVTSVGLALPNIFTVSGSPVTTTGTLTGTLATQNANLFFAGPVTGAAAAPTFRALGTGDLPLVINARLNDIFGANAPNTPQDSFNNKVEWQWNSLGNNTGLALTLSGTQAAGNGQTLFSSSVTGTNATSNQTTKAGLFSNTHGGGGQNIAAEFTASGGASNAAINVTAGNIIQAGGSIVTSGTLTLNNNSTLSGGGTNFHFPTTNGSNGDVLQTDGASNTSWVPAAGTAPGGSNGDIQFNNGVGGFGGSSNFNWNNVGQAITLAGSESITNATANALTIDSEQLNAITVLGHVADGVTGLDISSGGNLNNEVGMFQKDDGSTIASYTFKDNTGASDRQYIFAGRAIMFGLDTNTLNLLDNTGIVKFGTVTQYDEDTQTLNLGMNGLGAAFYSQIVGDLTGEVWKIYDQDNGDTLAGINTTDHTILFDQDMFGYKFGIGLDNPKSSFEVNGSSGFNWLNITGSATLDDSSTGWEYTGAGGDQFDLPSIAGSQGRHYVIKNKSISNLTVAAQAGENIYTTITVSSIVLAPGDSVTVDNDGVDWLVN